MAFNCNLELFAADRTKVDAFSFNLLHALISFQVSLLSTFSKALKFNWKSIFRCGGKTIFVWSGVCCVYNLNGSTQILLLHDVERRYSSERVLQSSLQLKYSSWGSWFNSKSKPFSCCSRILDFGYVLCFCVFCHSHCVVCLGLVSSCKFLYYDVD